MDSTFRIQVTLDESLDERQAKAARAAAGAHSTLHFEDPASHSVRVWVVSRLDAGTLQRLRAPLERGAPRTLVLSCAAPEPEYSVQALAHGAQDVLCGEDFEASLAEVVARAARIHEIETILQSALVRDHLSGSSAPWISLLRELIGHARFSEAPILLLGETGTGKELLARLCHTLDRRADKRDLWVVDCTTLTPELAASELFGHERGAFTGCAGARRGAIAEAHHGTLFLDEVGELPLEVQAKLLRTLQEGSYKPVGGDHWQQARFRLICATHRDLGAAVEEGRFRADLYFRIASCVLEVPPLRERSGDIAALSAAFLKEFGCVNGLDETVRRVLDQHPFPGNVRELRHLMQSAAQSHASRGPVSLGCLPRAWRERMASPAPAREQDSPPEAGPVDPEAVFRAWLEEGLGLQEIVQRAGDLAIQLALASEGNHLGRASRRLGVTERAIQLRKSRRAAARGAA